MQKLITRNIEMLQNKNFFEEQNEKLMDSVDSKNIKLNMSNKIKTVIQTVTTHNYYHNEYVTYYDRVVGRAAPLRGEYRVWHSDDISFANWSRTAPGESCKWKVIACCAGVG